MQNTHCTVCQMPLVLEISKKMPEGRAYKTILITEAREYTDADPIECFCPDCGIVYRYRPES